MAEIQEYICVKAEDTFPELLGALFFAWPIVAGKLLLHREFSLRSWCTLGRKRTRLLELLHMGGVRRLLYDAFHVPLVVSILPENRHETRHYQSCRNAVRQLVAYSP
jgi:hypothetical protein